MLYGILILSACAGLWLYVGGWPAVGAWSIAFFGPFIFAALLWLLGQPLGWLIERRRR